MKEGTKEGLFRLGMICVVAVFVIPWVIGELQVKSSRAALLEGDEEFVQLWKEAKRENDAFAIGALDTTQRIPLPLPPACEQLVHQVRSSLSEVGPKMMVAQEGVQRMHILLLNAALNLGSEEVQSSIRPALNQLRDRFTDIKIARNQIQRDVQSLQSCLQGAAVR